MKGFGFIDPSIKIDSLLSSSVIPCFLTILTGMRKTRVGIEVGQLTPDRLSGV